MKEINDKANIDRLEKQKEVKSNPAQDSQPRDLKFGA